MEVKDRKVLVLGAGKSGVASARFLASRGAVVALYDRKPIGEWSREARKLKINHKVGLIDGKVPSWLLDQIDLVVISPGVPKSVIPAKYVDRKDGEVIGEVELAYRFMHGKIAGITGSNGKTTTTSLVGELLKASGVNSQVGGNIGTPLLSLTGTSTADSWTVAELSSFQLETIKEFRPRVAACLNVTPNHLDRYDLFSDYAAAKHRIFMNQTREDVAILNADDKITSEWASGLKARVVFFSTARHLEEGFFLNGRELVCRIDGCEESIVSRDGMKLRGEHNVQNALAALAVGWACGAPVNAMRTAVAEFSAVEHRLEFVMEVRGVSFYNDSKATSVDATLKALQALAGDDGNIVLILGGRGKNAPYEPLAELISKKVSRIVSIGEDAERIEAELGELTEVSRAATMREAVAGAYGAAKKGDTVLLAPACASFDMFESFEERGRVFKEEVRRLTKGQAQVREAS